MTVQVSVNGQPREVPPGTTLGELVAMVTELASGVAAAVNGEVVPRGSWAARPLGDGDQVEVVTAVQGG
jgi:sulfur carrier protein